jgi:hypothetical protein
MARLGSGESRVSISRVLDTKNAGQSDFDDFLADYGQFFA